MHWSHESGSIKPVKEVKSLFPLDSALASNQSNHAFLAPCHFQNVPELNSSQSDFVPWSCQLCIFTDFPVFKPCEGYLTLAVAMVSEIHGVACYI